MVLSILRIFQIRFNILLFFSSICFCIEAFVDLFTYDHTPLYFCFCRLATSVSSLSFCCCITSSSFFISNLILSILSCTFNIFLFIVVNSVCSFINISVANFGGGVVGGGGGGGMAGGGGGGGGGVVVVVVGWRGGGMAGVEVVMVVGGGGGGGVEVEFLYIIYIRYFYSLLHLIC